MLTFYGADTKGSIAVEPGATELPPSVNWIDALDPTPEDMRTLAAVMKTRIPTHDELVEIESSSRLSMTDGVITMSLPATVRDEEGYPSMTPVGFVVTPKRVATLRFARLPSFENLTKEICAKGAVSAGGMGATVTILEIIVDHVADLLERVGGELDGVSRSIFLNEALNGKSHTPRRSGDVLHALLKNIGRHADLVSKVSETLLGLSRIPPFLASKGAEMLTTPEMKTRLETVAADVKSLHEFQEHLAGKTQFLLDSLLGLANIEQNNVFRVLTVVSVIGIPPTFVASMYGMNFKSMPELDWHYGYAYGLTVIALSALIPAVWFKVKGWW
jgi:magnesium transporter